MVQAGGLELALHRFESQTPSDKTILLLHGFLDAAATWDQVAEPLSAAGYEVLAPDLRGFGHSDRIGAGGYYHFPDYVADMDDLVRGLDRPWLAVVGHSMGGTVASLFAGTRPERVKKLVVMEGVGALSEPPELAVDRMRRWLADRARVNRAPRPIASLEEAVTRLAAVHPRVDRDVLATRAERLLRHTDGVMHWAWDPLHRTTSPMPFSAAVFASFLAGIDCPTLFISGGPHGWHLPDEEERLAHIRNLERFEIPGAGHMMHWTAPGEVARAILEFLAK